MMRCDIQHSLIHSAAVSPRTAICSDFNNRKQDFVIPKCDEHPLRKSTVRARKGLPGLAQPPLRPSPTLPMAQPRAINLSPSDATAVLQDSS